MNLCIRQAVFGIANYNIQIKIVRIGKVLIGKCSYLSHDSIFLFFKLRI